jgi:hypothetical protein
MEKRKIGVIPQFLSLYCNTVLNKMMNFLPDLVIEFKQYYTIPTHILYRFYENHFVGSLKPLFRENISHRFAFYLSRIGLPNIS